MMSWKNVCPETPESCLCHQCMGGPGAHSTSLHISVPHCKMGHSFGLNDLEGPFQLTVPDLILFQGYMFYDLISKKRFWPRRRHAETEPCSGSHFTEPEVRQYFWFLIRRTSRLLFGEVLLCQDKGRLPPKLSVFYTMTVVPHFVMPQGVLGGSAFTVDIKWPKRQPRTNTFRSDWPSNTRSSTQPLSPRNRVDLFLGPPHFQEDKT